MTMTRPKILVTGGAGYIGTHTVVELLDKGYKVVVIDNLDNSSEVAIERVKEITHCSDDSLAFEKIDLINFAQLETFFEQHKNEPFAACVHFAALKAVGESVALPLHYYHNNVTGSLNLLNLLDKYNCRNFIFSSSACVYGDPDVVPIPETAALRPANPYGKTKVFIETMATDLANANASKKWTVFLLRYFNPIGAHSSGKIGEDPQGFPNNLLPFVSQVAVGRRKELSIFGNDYDTADGTGVRDYVHVVDVAKGHVKALERVLENSGLGVEIYNLGTGKGVSVLEVTNAFSKACGKPIPYKIVARRPGDIASCYADVSKAEKVLGFVAEKGIDEMCRDAWKWQKNNPNGFRTAEEIQERETLEKQGKKVKRKGEIFELFGEP